MAARTWAVDAVDAERRPFAPRAQHVRDRRRRSRRAWWIAAVPFAIAFGCVLGYLVHDEGRANDRYDRSRAALGVTRSNITTTNHDLAVARRELALVTTQVGNDSTALAQVQSQLKAAQAALVAAQDHVSRQTSQIGSLNACLGGVEQALNALAVNQPANAIAALSAVSTSCTQATSSG
jgi:septal ring factor EnvC (AmiA/AmiB activator)